MAKAGSLQNVGDALVLQVRQNEPVEIKISGSGVSLVVLQAEVGSPGSGAWRDIKSWSRREDDKDEIEDGYSTPGDKEQNIRLVVKRLDKGASVSASMLIPAEEKPEEEEDKLREERVAEFIPVSQEVIDQRKKAESEEEAKTTTTSTSTTKKG